MSLLRRSRTGWRYVATKDGKALHLEHRSWDECREHVEYLHRCFSGHIFGIVAFYRKAWYEA